MSALNTALNTNEHNSLVPAAEFFLAVEQNDRRKLMELVSSHHVDPRLMKNDQQETLLHIAAQHGLIDMVRILVEIYQLCPFEVDQFSRTPFHHACQYRHLHVLSYLLGIGGHSHISEFQWSHYGNSQTVIIPADFELHLLSAAVSSGSVCVVRFVYTLLVFNEKQLVSKMKLSLFLDVFYILSKVIGSAVGLSHKGITYIHFIASLCKGKSNLGLLKFLLDELAYIHSLSVLDQTNE